MAKKPNYQFDRFERERKKAAKKAAKISAKQAGREARVYGEDECFGSSADNDSKQLDKT